MKFTKELEDKEKEEFESDDFAEVPPSDMVAFNELRSCADLVRMYKTDQLEIQPDFQEMWFGLRLLKQGLLIH